jgi:ATP-dependent Zn protease
MRKCFGRGVPEVIPDALVAGLELEDLVAVMRKGSRPAEVFTRLHNASRIRTNVDDGERLPRLEDAIEYGAARTWGLELAKDFADYNLGLCKWEDVSRGAVLHSPPGMGKSLFAKILARACRVPIVITSIPELFATSAGFLDSVIKAQRAVYTRCASINPCILFWDEIDALPNRATLSSRGADWWLPVIEDFMLLLDSAVSQREGICVIGATNRLNGIDAAIMRPGRLERAIEIQPPDRAGIANILRFHLDQNLRGVDLTSFATMLAGSTGADIMMVVRDARRIARQAGRAVTQDDLMAAIAPPETIPALALHRMTLHEAAHAVAAIASGLRVAYCRVQSSEGEAGRTVISFDRNDYLTAHAIETRVVGLLAGRVAERILIGAVSDGGASDLKSATGTIAAMHISSGLGDQLVYLGDETEALRQVQRDRRLRATVEEHLQQLQRRTEALVRQHRAPIIAVASELAVRRFLTGDAIEAILTQFPAKRSRLSRNATKSTRG